MTTQNLDYYRMRADEELAAADLAVDPAIAHIHLEMAQRYRDRLNEDAQPTGAAFAEPGLLTA